MIALVFTDVVGSSAAKRPATHGADLSAPDRAYLEAVQSKHLHLVRGAVAAHGGKEIMTMGDAFFLTFEDPVDALRCAAAIQQHLITEPIYTVNGPLRLRIGIHVGTPEFFENSWHGIDVDLAARTQSAASPGQVIVTDAARHLMGKPFGIILRLLGTFALKGVGTVRLWDADYDQHGLRSAALRSLEQKRRTNRAGLAAIAAILCAMLALLSRHMWEKHVEQLADGRTSVETSSIIVAEFENKTDNPVFDSTLTQAFTIQLQQSPVLSIVSPAHLRRSMQYLGKSPNDPLTPEVARQIGIREGVKAYLTGSIAQLGHSYLINASAVNINTGDSIASTEAQAQDKDHVLEALSNAATTMRTRLGESLASIQKLDTPLGQATTPSLDAFRAYALGDVEHIKGNDIPGAENHYLQAIELDPQFAMAWARLGAVYSNDLQFGKSLNCFINAYRFSRNVSERERFFILGNYYVSVTGDLEKMMAVSELACRTYPLDSGFYTELGVAQNAIGQLEAALASFHQALTLSPDSAVANSNYLNALTQLDRFPEALRAAENMRRLGLNDTADTIYIYDLHLLTGDTAGMARDIAVTQGRDDGYLMTGTIAYGQEFVGKYREANASWKKAAAQCAIQMAKDAQANYILFRLGGRALAGLNTDAGSQLKAALALDQSKPTQQLAAFAAALCNQRSIALKLMAGLGQTYPHDTIINRIILPQSRAALDLAAHDPQGALQELEGSQAFDLVSPGAYLEGLAQLALHNGAEAVHAFQRAIRYRGTALMGGAQDYGQAQLGLARAYVLTGDKTSAIKAYEALFATWKDADTDLPQLVTAKNEYAVLK